MPDSADEMSAPLTHTQMHTAFFALLSKLQVHHRDLCPPWSVLYTWLKKLQTARGGRGEVFQVEFMLTGHCYQISPGHTPLLPPFFLQTSAHSEPEWLCESLTPWRTPQRS